MTLLTANVSSKLLAVVTVVLALLAGNFYNESGRARYAQLVGGYKEKLLLFMSRPGPSSGLFPQGCRWRDTAANNVAKTNSFWAIRQYEYWDEDSNTWTTSQPEACRINAHLPPSHYKWLNGSRTGLKCTEDERHCVLRNLWYNQGKFYYVTDDEGGLDAVPLSRDVTIAPLVVKDASLFPSQIDARVVSGSTILIDFLFFIHPTAIGHWLEHLMPMVTALREEASEIPSPPDRVVILHLKRTHIMEWVRSVLATALNVPVNASSTLPHLYFQKEVASMWDQIGSPLEGIEDSQWLCFEQVLVVKDTFSKGSRIAKTFEDAQYFRRRAFDLHNVPVPPQMTSRNAKIAPPKTITLFKKSSNRRIMNEKALLCMLRQFAPVSVHEFTASTSFAEQLAVMASTGVLVSAHTSALANAVFLPPGSAVVELIHRNWAWPELHRSFKDQSDAMGDIHHYAWRAIEKEHVKYINPRDEERFGGEEWAGEKCDTDECVEAHTNVDIIVDIDAVRRLLEDRLPLIWNGAPVADAELPWPEP